MSTKAKSKKAKSVKPKSVKPIQPATSEAGEQPATSILTPRELAAAMKGKGPAQRTALRRANALAVKAARRAKVAVTE